MADAIDSKSIGLTPLWVQVPPPVRFTPSMKDLKTAFLGTFLAAAASPLLAAPRLCSNGLLPQLSGDAFSPVECSTTTKSTALLPDLPLRPGSAAKTDLRDLDGRWEGNLVHALGRYELLLTVKSSWGGKTELTLDMNELQFHQRLTDRMSLVPAQERGAYKAVLTTTMAAEASLKGVARIGAAAGIELSTATARTPVERQMDMLFANGAAHRILFSAQGKDALRLQAFSAIPGAPLQKFELVLTRTKRESL